MNTKRLIILICFLLTCLFGCNSTTRAKKIGEISFNMNPPYAVVNHAVNCIEGNSLLILQSLKDMNLHFFEFNSEKVEKSYTLNSKVINSLPYFQLFVKDFDSIVVFNPLTSCITIVDSTGLVIFEEKLESGVPTLNPDNPLNCIGNKLYLGNSSRNLNVGLPLERNEYFQTVKPIYQIDLQNATNSERQWGSFPRKYADNNYDFLNYFPDICPYSAESVLVSFASDDSVYLFENECKVRSVLYDSKFINNFMPYPEKKRLDMAFYKNFLFSEPKYIALIYNKYTQQYLRVARHRFIYKSENKFDSEHMKWSIVIMNNKFKIINEFVFDYRYNSPDVILCTIDGIYISDVPNSHENINQLSLSLYKF